MIHLAFVVSTYEDPMALMGCLASLKLQQTNGDCKISIHVTDNSVRSEALDNTEDVCKLFDDVKYYRTQAECYGSAEYVVLEKSFRADYVCFASSDSYYVPGFTLTMLETAYRSKADLVYCNCLYDPRLHGRGLYSVLETFPEMRWIDKTSFIVRKSLFKGFPLHEKDWRDGALVESFVKKNYKLAKAKGVLVVHN